jgi:hypothetical protein
VAAVPGGTSGSVAGWQDRKGPIGRGAACAVATSSASGPPNTPRRMGDGSRWIGVFELGAAPGTSEAGGDRTVSMAGA